MPEPVGQVKGELESSLVPPIGRETIHRTMRLYALVQAGDPEAIDVYLAEEESTA